MPKGRVGREEIDIRLEEKPTVKVSYLSCLKNKNFLSLRTILQSVPICATAHYVMSSVFVMVPNDTEVLEVACTVGWDVLVLCGCWNVWIDKLSVMGSAGIVWLFECVT